MSRTKAFLDNSTTTKARAANPHVTSAADSIHEESTHIRQKLYDYYGACAPHCP